MMRHENEETLEREVRLWLERKGIPYQIYGNFPPHNKVTLRNLVCVPTQLTTPAERKDLYRKLFVRDIAGRGSTDPSDFVPDEKIKETFMPLTPSERLHDLEKY